LENKLIICCLVVKVDTKNWPRPGGKYKVAMKSETPAG
jgi:hypothetical protein